MFTVTIARRASAVLAGGALVVSGLGLAGLSPAARAAEPSEPNAAAVALDGWLSGQLSDGLLLNDVGLTIDYALGLQANGLPTAAAKAGIDAHLPAYVGTEDAPKSPEAAKAAYAYQALEVAPPFELLGDYVVPHLVGTEDSAALVAGVQAYQQVWGVLALKKAGNEGLARATATYLVEELQCADGGWGFKDAGGCYSDPDTTALAVLALAPFDDLALKTAYDNALAYLKSQQAADGSFSNFGANANSTAVAGWVLGMVGETDSAARAARWIADHQVAPVPACSTPLDAEAGAIAWKDATLAQGLAEGITASTTFTWGFAGGQSLAVLAYLADAPATTPRVTGPTGFVRAGTTVTVKVSGVRPGQASCLTGFGTKKWKIGSGSATAKLPAATGNRVLSLRRPTTTATVTIKALAAKTMSVVLARSVVPRGGTQTLLASGFVPGEPVSVTYRGAVVRRGVAGADGRYKTSFPVGRISGAKTVLVQGAFAVRRGTKSFTVR